MQYPSTLISDDVFDLAFERYETHVSINSPVKWLYEAKGFSPVPIRM